MNKLILLPLLLLLSGCVNSTINSFEPYAPLLEMKDHEAYNLDLTTCRVFAAGYNNSKSSLDASQIAQEGSTGALKNLGTGVVAPLAIPLYGLGSASGEVLAELGLDTQVAKKIVSDCMFVKGLKSGAYSIYDPNL